MDEEWTGWTRERTRWTRERSSWTKTGLVQLPNQTSRDYSGQSGLLRGERIIGAPVPNLQNFYISRVRKRAKKITLDPTHPSHSLLELLASGLCYRAPTTRTARNKNSVLTQAIFSLNNCKTFITIQWSL